MGWLGSRHEPMDDQRSLATYPAPSAAAVPTTITEGRNSAANEIANQNTAPYNSSPSNAPNDSSPPGNPTVTMAATPGPNYQPAPATQGYPDTQYPSLPVAPAAAPAVNVAASGYANMQPPNGGSYPGSPAGDVQDGYYPMANSGSTTTWGGPAQSAAGPGGSYAQNSLSDHNTYPPTTTAGSTAQISNQPVPDYANNQTASDFVAGGAGPMTNAPSRQTDFASVGTASATSPTHDEEFARYDGVTGGVANVATAAYSAPIAPDQTAARSSESTPSSLASPTTSNSAPSHYASIADEEIHRAATKARAWHPGSTTSLPQSTAHTASQTTASQTTSGWE